MSIELVIGKDVAFLDNQQFPIVMNELLTAEAGENRIPLAGGPGLSEADLLPDPWVPQVSPLRPGIPRTTCSRCPPSADRQRNC
jgi:hypothetical protein